MKAPPIALLALVPLTVASIVGCAASGKTEKVLEEVVTAGLEAKLTVLSRPENLERIERITETLLQAEVTRTLAREMAESAVLGLSDAAQEEALRDAFSGLVDGLTAALTEAGGEQLKPELASLLSEASSSAVRGLLDHAVREDARSFAEDLSRAVAAALLDEVAAELPAMLDASAARLSPRIAGSLTRDVGPALATTLTVDLLPALSESLEQTLGPALRTVLAEQLIPAIDQAAAERLPPLVRDSTREAMLGLGDALEGELGKQTRAFVFSLAEEAKGHLLPVERKVGTGLLALAVALIAVLLACVYFWKQARERRQLLRARESALFLVTNTINRLPEELQTRIKSAVAESGRKDGGERTGGAELQLFLDRYNL